jgi:4-amino-4-deoxy-L-arabinose transferase-like glycosyltransferase
VTGFLDSRVTRWSLLALALLFFAISNLPWHLDDYDQAKQAFTSYEMVERGHWLYQHTPNWWVATKPPLVGWISAGFFAVTRTWELAWRLPSFLGAVGLLALIVRAAAVYGRIPALVAGCAFSFNLFVPRLASLVRTDMPLALVVFAIGWLIWDKIRRRENWTARDRLLLFFLLSAGMLIKGPIVYAFLVPGLVAFEWRQRRNGDPVTAWGGWLPWLASFLVFLLWVAGGIHFVPEFIEHVVLREFAGRFSDEAHRPQPFYFYLPHLLHRFAPWSLLLIMLPILAVRKSAGGIRAAARGMSPETFWLLAWSLGGLAVMSFVPSKRIDRIFPMVPPLCLLLAAMVGNFRKREGLRRTIDWSVAVAIILGCVVTTGYVAGRIVAANREHRNAFAQFGRAVVKAAEEHGWRYAIVGGDDEGMLLYVRRLEFIEEPEQAAAQWNAKKWDALVVPEDEMDGLLPRFEGAEPKRFLRSEPAGRYRRRYLLLVRPSSS